MDGMTLKFKYRLGQLVAYKTAAGEVRSEITSALRVRDVDPSSPKNTYYKLACGHLVPETDIEPAKSRAKKATKKKAQPKKVQKKTPKKVVKKPAKKATKRPARKVTKKVAKRVAKKKR